MNTLRARGISEFLTGMARIHAEEDGKTSSNLSMLQQIPSRTQYVTVSLLSASPAGEKAYVGQEWRHRVTWLTAMCYVSQFRTELPLSPLRRFMALYLMTCNLVARLAGCGSGGASRVSSSFLVPSTRSDASYMLGRALIVRRRSQQIFRDGKLDVAFMRL